MELVETHYFRGNLSTRTCWKSAGCCWKLLDVVGSCWMLLELFCNLHGSCWKHTVHCWMFQHCNFQHSSNNFQQLTVQFQQHPATSNNFQQVTVWFQQHPASCSIVPTASSNFQQHPADFQQHPADFQQQTSCRKISPDINMMCPTYLLDEPYDVKYQNHIRYKSAELCK